jgi:ABC-2 type transport system permease protein
MQLLLMIKYQLKLLFRNRLAIFMMIAAPVLLTVLFSLVGSGDGKAQLGLVDLDHSTSSKQLIQLLKKQENVKLIHLSRTAMQHDVGNQSVSSGLVIGSHYERALLSSRKLDLTLIQSHSSDSSTLIDQDVLEAARAQKKMVVDATTVSRHIHADKTTLLSQFYRRSLKSSAVSVSDHSPSMQYEMRQQNLRTLIGFLTMFVWFVVFQGLRTMIEEKKNHAFERMISAPARYRQIVLSKMVATFLFSAFHVAAILLVASYFFKLNLLSHLLTLCVLFAVYLLALVGVSLIFVPFFKKQQQFTILSTMIVVLTGLLGGSFFSIETFAPRFVVWLSRLTPESWAIRAINAVMIDGQTLTAQITPFLVLVGAGCIGFMLSLLSMRVSVRMQK